MKRTLLLSTLVIAALVVAGCFDARVAGWVHQRDLRGVFRAWRWPLAGRWAGNFLYCALPVALLVGVVSRRRWRGAALVAGSGAVSGLFYVLVKWCVGRTRPFPQHAPSESPFAFHPFNHGIVGLWKAENQAFPSGHACLAFATAAALGRLFPRGVVLFYSVAMLTAAERVLEGAHYPSDAVAGAGLGLLAAWFADWALKAVWSDNQSHELSGRLSAVPFDRAPQVPHDMAGSERAARGAH